MHKLTTRAATEHAERGHPRSDVAGRPGRPADHLLRRRDRRAH
ncbi:hypothetical protein I550_4472 [Mycobacterium intracellulare 1956]|uniref:Uncharacterized protein n=1 Tax=Mycobacterium intracellulare 1956 TaxID=1299331 RepID=X8CLK7_MYCIT|nr:hypothetical protein I550_4472 [Mycobacterium intracellulare 1956]